jgi:uncharacterized membrane protein
MPVKLLGIIPSIAYNIILPLWYSLLVIGAYSIGWNITRALLIHRDGETSPGARKLFGKPFAAGIFTALLLAFVGNLGTVRLIEQTLRTMGAGGAAIEGASFLNKLVWFFKGFGLLLKGMPMPLYPGDWYWFPSRVIPGDPITEFPYFTFLYADLHRPPDRDACRVFAVAWGLSALLSSSILEKAGRESGLEIALSFFIGALVLARLKPTNPGITTPFCCLTFCLLGYNGLNYQPIFGSDIKAWWRRLLPALGMIAALTGLSMLLYSPFNRLFHPGYNQIGLWTGDRTPLSSYFTHWGLLLFIIVFWYAWETYQWLAVTPLSALKRLEPHKNLLKISGLVLGGLLALLFTSQVSPLIDVPMRPGRSSCC